MNSLNVKKLFIV